MMELLKNKTTYQITLVFLLAIEVFSFYVLYHSSTLATFLMYGAGLGIGLLIIYHQKGNNEALKYTYQNWLLLGVGLVCLNWVLNLFNTHHLTFPIGLYYADMLPMIEVQCKRFLAGGEIYKVIPEIYNQEPVYLPAMWLPFSLPIKLGLDMRWAGFIALELSLLFSFLFISKKSATPFFVRVLFIGVACVLIQLLLNDSFSFVMQSEEALVVFYYSLFVIALYSENPYFIGGSLSLCLLSRYSLLFWLITVIVFLVFKKNNYSQVFKIGISCSLSVLALLAFSHSLNDILYFTTIPNKYIGLFSARSLTNELYTMSAHLFGFVKYTQSIPFPIFLKATFVINFFLPVLLFYIFKKQLFDKASQKWVLIGILKISVMSFLFLTVCPYTYLFFPSVFISLMAVSLSISE